MKKRPTIGVTGPDRAGEVAWIFTALSVLLAGGKPVWIRPKEPRSIEKVDGLIIGGGSDVDPDVYQQQGLIDEYLKQTIKNPQKSFLEKIKSGVSWLIFPLIFLLRKLFSRKVKALDRERDQLELSMIDQAVKKGLPILGICRGAQLLNVYFKGDLYQDINTFYYEQPNKHSIFPVKTITIKPESKLREILQVEKTMVNALHHQAVKKTGNDVSVSALETNEVIVQGIENTEQEFIVGVQWHPEYLLRSKRQRRIFKSLVHYARKPLVPKA